MKKMILLLLACSLLLTGCGTAAGSSENPASAQQDTGPTEGAVYLWVSFGVFSSLTLG